MTDAALPTSELPTIPPPGVDAAVASLRTARETAAKIPAEKGGSAPATPRNIPEPATSDTDGAADTESTSQEDDAAADPSHDQPPGEDEEADRAGEPLIVPPKSWTAAEKEAFNSLPPEHQQAIADRETERDAYYRKGHDEAAKIAREAEARGQAAEQARQQYEQALPALYERLYGQFQSEFGDIKTPDDVARLRTEDPMRWMAYRDARENAIQVHHEAQAAGLRQAQQSAQSWRSFVSQEDEAFLKAAPEYKDEKKAAALASDARKLFDGLGFKSDELAAMWDGGKPVSLRDHRIQLALRKAVLYDRAQAALKTAQPKPVPPVQRPGTSSGKVGAGDARIAELRNKLRSTGKVDDAVALLRAREKRRA